MKDRSRGKGPGSNAHYVDTHQPSDELAIAEDSDILINIKLDHHQHSNNMSL